MIVSLGLQDEHVLFPPEGTSDGLYVTEDTVFGTAEPTRAYADHLALGGRPSYFSGRTHENATHRLRVVSRNVGDAELRLQQVARPGAQLVVTRGDRSLYTTVVEASVHLISRGPSVAEFDVRLICVPWWTGPETDLGVLASAPGPAVVEVNDVPGDVPAATRWWLTCTGATQLWLGVGLGVKGTFSANPTGQADSTALGGSRYTMNLPSSEEADLYGMTLSDARAQEGLYLVLARMKSTVTGWSFRGFSRVTGVGTVVGSSQRTSYHAQLPGANAWYTAGCGPLYVPGGAVPDVLGMTGTRHTVLQTDTNGADLVLPGGFVAQEFVLTEPHYIDRLRWYNPGPSAQTATLWLYRSVYGAAGFELAGTANVEASAASWAEGQLSRPVQLQAGRHTFVVSGSSSLRARIWNYLDGVGYRTGWEQSPEEEDIAFGLAGFDTGPYVGTVGVRYWGAVTGQVYLDTLTLLPLDGGAIAVVPTQSVGSEGFYGDFTSDDAKRWTVYDHVATDSYSPAVVTVPDVYNRVPVLWPGDNTVVADAAVSSWASASLRLAAAYRPRYLTLSWLEA